MKKLLLIAILALSFSQCGFAATQKKFCHSYIVHHKSNIICKTVKLHKKVDGIPVPRKVSKNGR